MPNKPRDRKELGFFEHVEELRARIIRSVLYITLGSAAGWIWREPLLEYLRRPAEVGAKMVGVDNLPFRVFEPLGGFMIAIQVALVAGIILAAPLVLYEIWAFIEPALEERERKYAIVILPFSVLLFFGGVAFCYYVSPRAFAFLFSIDQTLGVQIERTLQPYLWFILRLMLGFGLAFELPLVLMFLGVIGLVNSRQLLAWWRYALVLIFVFAAIVTPTVDPVNMTILAAPMMALYMVSILLVRFVQRKKEQAEEGVLEEEYSIPQPDPEEAEDTTRETYEEAHAASEAKQDEEALEAEFVPEPEVKAPEEAAEPTDTPDTPGEDSATDLKPPDR
ncbi:twin-arginine translocase subunit TatC [bacterium]|nr:twin-arginine translocase subunit TatC [bacterium]